MRFGEKKKENGGEWSYNIAHLSDDVNETLMRIAKVRIETRGGQMKWFF